MLISIPISLYIHTPWCIEKCPYCDFNSHKAKTFSEDQYIDALIRDYHLKAPFLLGRSIHSVFIGGGTPSLFSSKAYAKLFKAIDIPSSIEITLEANPGTVDLAFMTGYRETGINRISLGIQSFNHHHLKRLGRIHSSDEAKKAIKVVQKIGFDSFNLDLMFGLPQQHLEEALADLEKALSFNPPHLSWYQLTLEPNTVFAKFPPTLPKDDAIADMEAAGKSLITSSLPQYEISAYSKTYPCQHNLNYWLFGDYVGIGAGAHSKVTHADGKIERLWNKKQPTSYMEHPEPLLGRKTIQSRELALEYLMNVLRLTQATSLSNFERNTLHDKSFLLSALAPLCEQGFVELKSDCIQTTALGRRFLMML